MGAVFGLPTPFTQTLRVLCVSVFPIAGSLRTWETLRHRDAEGGRICANSNKGAKWLVGLKHQRVEILKLPVCIAAT